MKNYGSFQVLSQNISACDYEFVLQTIKKTIHQQKSLLISPIASQTLVKSFFDHKLHKVLNRFHMLLPDSLWVKKSLCFLYGICLKDRVYGPELLNQIGKSEIASKNNLFFYGTTRKTLSLLKKKMKKLNPQITIKGMIPSIYRKLTEVEESNLVDKFVSKKTQILFVGLGSPLQETVSVQFLKWFQKLNYPIIIIPIGAAFDFNSKNKEQAPIWMQHWGFEWLFRLIQEPKRLWTRYIILGPIFIFMVLIQKFGVLFNLSNRVVVKSKM